MGRWAFINAVHHILRRNNIDVTVDGDFDQLNEHEGGILFVGDHKNQWEFVALMDLLIPIKSPMYSSHPMQ